MTDRRLDEESASRIAAAYGKRIGLAPFSVGGVVADDSDPNTWRVVLDFDDAPLGLPGFIVVDVDALTGTARSKNSL